MKKAERRIILGNLLGMAAGLLMIALIVILLFKFISDLGVKYNEEIVYGVKRYSLWGLLFFVATYIVGGIIYSFNNPDGFTEEKYTFDLEWVWDFAVYTNYKGMPSLYNLLKDGFSKILFDQTLHCALYISLICAVITCASFGIILKKTVDKKAADRCFLLLMCCPFAYYIFMPAPYAMFLAMFMMFMAFVVYDKKKWAVLPAMVACITHINGLLLIILWLLYMFAYRGKRYRNLLLMAVTFIFQCGLIALHGINGWGAIEEITFTAIIPIIICNSEFKWIRSNNAYKIVLMTVVILSGLFICKNVYITIG